MSTQSATVRTTPIAPAGRWSVDPAKRALGAGNMLAGDKVILSLDISALTQA
jgi:hypothetical protein